MKRFLRGGFTLIEVLIAVTITLIMMAVVVQVFSTIGSAVNEGRAMINVIDRLRATHNLLKHDLAGATCVTLPPRPISAEGGYFEIVEGPQGVVDHPWNNPDNNTLLGDRDDVVMFTSRHVDGRFVGKGSTARPTIESPLAEVVWFTRPSSDTTVPLASRMYTLYRRIKLIVPRDTNLGGVTVNDDISAHRDANGLAPNTLIDLTRREYRAFHNDSPPNFQAAYPTDANDWRFTGERVNEDVVLTNILMFDVKVWDIGAPIITRNIGGTERALLPGDPDYSISGSKAGVGAYADLGWAGDAWNDNLLQNPADSPRNFGHKGHPKSRLGGGNYRTFDTWSNFYNFDGVGNDEGADTFENNSAAGPDDAQERDTFPPYPAPLRGLQIKIRVYEPDTRQVREVTILHNFLPE